MGPGDGWRRPSSAIIVQYRSRGFLHGGTGGEYPIHVFAAHGFFVLSWDRPEFRDIEAKLAGEKAFRYVYSQNREHISKQSALDVILESLEERGLIDSAGVGITGLSDGAETVRIGLIHSDRFAAASLSQAGGAPLS